MGSELLVVRQESVQVQSVRESMLNIEQLCNEKSNDKRIEILHSVTDLFFATEEQVGEEEKVVFGDVMNTLAAELEVEARRELSARLSSSTNAPRQTAMKLACDDEISVASPMLEQSVVLQNSDLVKIAGTKSQAHLLALSGRQRLSQDVTDVIVERGDDRVVARVAGNEGARFSQAGFDSMARRASVSDGPLRDALCKRHDIPERIVESIKENVAQKLHDDLSTQNFGISADLIESVVSNRAAAMNLGIGDDAPGVDIVKMHEMGQLSENMLAQFARERKISEAVTSLGLLAGVDENIARHCMFNADISALGILCKAIDLEKDTFSALMRLKSGMMPLSPEAIVRAVSRYEDLDADTAKRIIRFLKIRAATAE
jgi:uncharacterized protein (DUF2336 family)